MGAPRRLAVIVLLVAVLAGCTEPDPPPAPPGEPFELYTHCGIIELRYGTQFYSREDGQLDDGSGNPPPSWDNPSQAGWLEVLGDRAVFRDDHGHEEVFVLVPGQTDFSLICS